MGAEMECRRRPRRSFFLRATLRGRRNGWQRGRRANRSHAGFDLRSSSRLMAARAGGAAIARSPIARWRRCSATTSPNMGFTHVELMPVMEHPFTGSWGYQVSGYFAPTSRYGTPDDFALPRRLAASPRHRRDPRLGARAFSHGRIQPRPLRRHRAVRACRSAPGRSSRMGHLHLQLRPRRSAQFPASRSAEYWLSEFHADGLRVDAVASMLYLDYARREGEWIPNAPRRPREPRGDLFPQEAQRAGLRAQSRRHDDRRGVHLVAGRQPPGLHRRARLRLQVGHGLDARHARVLHARIPIYRRYHHRDLTFGLLYAWSENFVLPLSHDEVVHGKRSMLAKMPGDRWQQFANLRALFAYMWARPGKKMIFMGERIRPVARMEPRREPRLEPARVAASIADCRRWCANSIASIAREPALWEADHDPAGFQWIDADNADDNMIAFMRIAPTNGRRVICVGNFSPVSRSGYRVGVPRSGYYREILNTDAERMGRQQRRQRGRRHRPNRFHATDCRIPSRSRCRRSACCGLRCRATEPRPGSLQTSRERL